MTDPTGRMTGRFRRIARLSGALGGSAVKVAGQRWLGIDFDRSAHSRRLQTILGDLHGPAMKVAQLLAVVPEALPDEYTTAFAKLQTNAPPMGWSFVQRRMCAELGSGWAGRFAAFDREPFAAASLGQVHAATEHDGRLLACKLQYPDMGRMIDADLAQLKLALKLFDKAEGAVTTDAAFAEIAERLREELDYRREAALIRLYGLMLADVPDICVPEPVPDLSTDRLLTMTRLTGAGIETLKETPEDVRAAAARKIMTAWYGPFFSFGVLHGDPHPGNYTFGEDGRLNLMDFGCVR
ncbi:MAG: AarF/ABC1/UbiB kinase family protein, partial [Pseudomonadota bacterium]|nr:AarF/ABC1/UbiB kinase family protein [Pseudomonadota bacterium]